MVLVNPRGDALGQSHVILNGRGRDYHVPDFAGPLSIKSVLSGAATWQTAEGHFELRPGSCLIVNDRQPYSMTIESKHVVETLCVFFARGFVEDVARTLNTADAQLLAEPHRTHTVEFHQRTRPDDRALVRLLGKLHRTRDEAAVIELAEALLRADARARTQAGRLPAARLSTREELWRRLQRGRNVIEGSLAEPLCLDAVAREAALSPYHFHRAFTRLFGETPYAYLTRRRMERAQLLLKSTDWPVTEVCFACGYQSLGSFSALFRKHAGISPSSFRGTRI
jgi:AraC family transcriptional regulator